MTTHTYTPIKNINEVEFTRTLRHGERFEAKVANIGIAIGAQKLAYNITEVAPGKRAFPFHNHHVNEEMFLVLAGKGVLRFGEAEYPVREGDVVACPPGGKEVAHQLRNTGNEPLRYFALSTAMDTDVFQYPDSGKFGLAAGRKPGQAPLDAPFAGFYEEDSRVDYWQGE